MAWRDVSHDADRFRTFAVASRTCNPPATLSILRRFCKSERCSAEYEISVRKVIPITSAKRLEPKCDM